MDFETDKEIEDEMNMMLDDMVIPMMEGTGSVELMGILFPDNAHLPKEMKEKVTDSGKQACMVFPSAAASSKDEWYEGVSEITKKMRIRNAFMISDTWIVEGAKDLSVAPSNHPDRKDAFVIHYVNTDIHGILMKTAMLVCTYKIEENVVHILERNFKVDDNWGELGIQNSSKFANAVANHDWA
jgi:hypothetical protein